jgi:hypothetical protein
MMLFLLLSTNLIAPASEQFFFKPLQRYCAGTQQTE